MAREQLGGGLRAYARRAGQPIRGVAAQRDEVRDLLGIDSVALAHLRGSHLPGDRALGQLDDRDLLVDGREQVAIAGQQQGSPALLGLAARVRVHRVVGLELARVTDHPGEAGEQRRSPGPLGGQLRRHRIAVCVIGREQLDAVARLLGAEARHDRARRALGQHREQRVDRSEQRVDRPALAVCDRGGQRKERAVQQPRYVGNQQRRWIWHPLRVRASGVAGFVWAKSRRLRRAEVRGDEKAGYGERRVGGWRSGGYSAEAPPEGLVPD